MPAREAESSADKVRHGANLYPCRSMGKSEHIFCPIIDRDRVSRYYSAMTKTTTLCTFGYEGLTIEAFIARLKESGVRTIIDVRELPLSRKKGFSKKAFAEALHGNG
ncbi:MAG: DUF488 domain-containing protein, partial [Holophaga sp.]|nr:DUF488 domain-containing protein [Holophaga sp.]